MQWKEVVEQYGFELSEKMKNSDMLCCITVRVIDNGEFDYPESDIELAFKDVSGIPIHPLEWD